MSANDYAETIALIERLHRRFLDVLRAELERHGIDEVEAILDSCHALMNYGVDRFRRPSTISPENERLRQREREEFLQKQVNDLWRTIPAKEKMDKDDVTDCINTVRSILPHVSDCEGLSIMVERMDDEILQSICDSMESARKENLPLIEWSETARNRIPLSIS